MNKNIKLITVSLIVLALGISNIFFAKIPNFSPVAAMALFGGVYLKDKKAALLIPILAMLISDFFVGFHDMMWAVYLSFGLTVGLGVMMKKVSATSVLGNSIVASILFFAITNFAVWTSGYYPMNTAGLIECYTMAIPFFKNTLISNVLFSSALFGIFHLATLKFPKLAKVKN